MNFDDIMRQKMSEGEFPFSEANWEKAETMIIAAEKKKKRRIVFFIFFLGALVGIAFMLPFVFNQKEEKSANSIKKIEKEKEAPLNIEANRESNDDSGNEASSNDVKENANYENTSPKPENEALKENSISKSNLESDNVKEEKIITKHENISPAFKNKTENHSEEIKEKGNLVADNVSNKNSPLNPKEKKQDKEFVARNVNDKTSSLSLKDKKQVSNKTETFSKIDKEQKNADISLNSTKKENEKQSNAIVKSEKDSNSIPLNQAEQQPEKKDSIITINVPKKDTTQNKTGNVVQNKIDSVQAMPVVENKKKEELKQQKNFFSIDAGTNYCFGWKSNIHTEAAGFNFLAGLSFTHYFNEHWSVLVGAQYNNLSHLTESYSSSNTQYGFGYTKTITMVTPKTLHYLAIPIKAQYNINPKNIISLGVTPMFLLNSNSMVDTYTQADFVTATHIVKTKSGYMDGLNTFDMQLSLAYRRRFLKRFVLGVEAYYDFCDIRYNSYWGNNTKENNRGLKLILSYNFIK